MKKQEALERNINIYFLCGDLTRLALKEDEIVLLFGNLLDNAIEAAEKAKADKRIQVRMIQEDKQFVLSIKNSCTQPFREEGGALVSTKLRKEEHGYGINAVRNLVGKYDGAFAIKKDGDFVKVTVVIPEP